MTRTTTVRGPARGRRLAAVGVLAGVLVGGLGVAFSGTASAATAPTLDCSTDPTIFNTGYDSSAGQILADGSTDLHWQTTGPYYDVPYAQSYGVANPPRTVALPPAGATWEDAYVVRHPAWTGGTDVGDAQYISRTADGVHADYGFNPDGTPDPANFDGEMYYYRYDFDLAPGVGLETVGLDFFADNTVMEVWVNGQAQSPTNPSLPAITNSPWANNPYYNGGFVEGGQASVALSDGWQTGRNSIIVQIASSPGAEGFLAQFTGEFACEPAVLVDDSASTPADTPVTVDIDENDTIPEGSTGWDVDTTTAEGGTVVDNGDGTVTYTPPAGFTGTDTFTYRVTGPDGVEVEATVTVTVTEDPEPPVPAISLAGTALALA
ncbi:Ig-like domain-containing protein, partial [Promicromonospora kroppenstedtii]|uniref:Ig-like domain-containing protein n=1 Tax=Promicromonospora kroppenstedtii TaxID=440482 RepID=UPI00146FA66D